MNGQTISTANITLTHDERQALAKDALKHAEACDRVSALRVQARRWREISRELDPEGGGDGKPGPPEAA